MNSTLSQPEVQRALSSFLSDRRVNREFYERVPEDRFDYRMVDTPSRRSDTPRESLAHQIRVQREYLRAMQTGKLEFGALSGAEAGLRLLSKTALLRELKAAEDELARTLAEGDALSRQIEVPWSGEKQSILSVLEALHFHEVLHTGWNLAIMDHLDMERYPALREVWG